MRKIAFLLLSIVFLLSGCSDGTAYTELKNGNLLSPDGVEYTLIATEPEIYYLGSLVFEGGVKGEEPCDDAFQNGIYTIAESSVDDILIRYFPNDEWFKIYRKATLPPLDLSPERCIQLELFSSEDPFLRTREHPDCADGIKDPAVIAEFYADVLSQKSPDEAGLLDLVRQPDGRLETKGGGVIYAFFENEPDLALPMFITSYNDAAYSVSIEGKSYVLPEKWVDLLIATSNVG